MLRPSNSHTVLRFAACVAAGLCLACVPAGLSLVYAAASSSLPLAVLVHRAAQGVGPPDGVSGSRQEAGPAGGGDRFRRCVKEYADKLDAIRPGLGKLIRSHPGKVRNTSSRKVVIGVGSGSTATSSLVTAFTELGMVVAHDHWAPIPPEKWCPYWSYMRAMILTEPSRCIPALRAFDFTTLPEGLEAIVDTPTYELFVDFYLAFPRAQYVLSDRPAESWVRSRMRFAETMTSSPLQEPCGHTIRHRTRGEMAPLFTTTNDLVRCLVPRERLFEVNLFQNSSPAVFADFARFLRVRPPKEGLAFPQEKSDAYHRHYSQFRHCDAKRWPLRPME